MGFLELFNAKKPILAMVHLKGESREEKVAIALKEIELYYENGVDAVIVEDYFGSKWDAEAVLKEMPARWPGKLWGVNILDNFHRSWELAALYGGRFIQIDSAAGHLPAKLDAAYEKMIAAYRATGDDIYVLGGVRFKYQPVLSGRPLAEDMALGKARSDAIVVTGEGTGLDTSDEKIRAFRELLGGFPLIIGAGVTPENAAAKLALGDGAIVGSCFKDTGVDTGDVSAEKVRAFMAAVQPLRG